MVENTKPVRVAVNVMRSRLTVIGFNIAIVSFMIARIGTVSGGLTLPGVDHAVHIGASMDLFMALALSFISMVAYITSGAYDEIGMCTHWSLVAGDLFMYLALAQTVAGFFAPLATSMQIIANNFPNQAGDIVILHAAPLVAGGLAWFLATYVGPVVSLVRSPFCRRTNITLGAAYLVVLVTLSWISSHAERVDGLVSSDESGIIFSVCMELIQPFRW